MSEDNQTGQMAAAVVALCSASQRGLLTSDQFWTAFDRLTFFPGAAGRE